MIKSLKDARIVDGLPRIVAEQPWVRAFSEALGELHQKTLEHIDGSQIYTAIDTAAEPVLDALAVNWKIDWYDTGYSIEQKRRIVKTALTIRRTMGTVGAVKSQADAIYPGTTLEEWFDWGGEPGLFRLNVDVTTTGPGNTIDIHGQAEIERRLTTAKRYSAHLESMSYQIKHTIKTDSLLTMWRHKPPLCATIRCGVYHTASTLGWSERTALATAGVAEAFLATPEVSGTIPQTATVGYSMCGTLLGGGVAEAFAATPPENGTIPSGTHHALSTLGWSGGEVLAAAGAAEVFKATPEVSGTIPQTATQGYSLCGALQSGGADAAAVYTGKPSESGAGHCGTKP